MDLRLGLLDAHDVGRLARHPVKETFAGCCPNAVGIQADNAKQIDSPMSYFAAPRT